MSFELLRVNSTGAARREGEYLVAHLSMLVPGVLPGSAGPLYYPVEEVRRSASSWNGVPLTLRHPARNGQYVDAASAPEQQLGEVRRAKFHRGKLRAEGWFHEETTRNRAPEVWRALVEGIPMELSTGLFTDNEPAPAGAAHNGRPFTHVARGYRPDHLAVLPDSVGACSLEDGCGVGVANEWSDAAREASAAARRASASAEAATMATTGKAGAAASRRATGAAAAGRHVDASDAHDAAARAHAAKAEQGGPEGEAHLRAAAAHREASGKHLEASQGRTRNVIHRDERGRFASADASEATASALTASRATGHASAIRHAQNAAVSSDRAQDEESAGAHEEARRAHVAAAKEHAKQVWRRIETPFGERSVIWTNHIDMDAAAATAAHLHAAEAHRPEGSAPRLSASSTAGAASAHAFAAATNALYTDYYRARAVEHAADAIGTGQQNRAAKHDAAAEMHNTAVEMHQRAQRKSDNEQDAIDRHEAASLAHQHAAYVHRGLLQNAWDETQHNRGSDGRFAAGEASQRALAASQKIGLVHAAQSAAVASDAALDSGSKEDHAEAKRFHLEAAKQLVEAHSGKHFAQPMDPGHAEALSAHLQAAEAHRELRSKDPHLEAAGATAAAFDATPAKHRLTAQSALISAARAFDAKTLVADLQHDKAARKHEDLAVAMQGTEAGALHAEASALHRSARWNVPPTANEGRTRNAWDESQHSRGSDGRFAAGEASQRALAASRRTGIVHTAQNAAVASDAALDSGSKEDHAEAKRLHLAAAKQLVEAHSGKDFTQPMQPGHAEALSAHLQAAEAHREAGSKDPHLAAAGASAAAFDATPSEHRGAAQAALISSARALGSARDDAGMQNVRHTGAAWRHKDLAAALRGTEAGELHTAARTLHKSAHGKAPVDNADEESCGTGAGGFKKGNKCATRSEREVVSGALKALDALQPGRGDAVTTPLTVVQDSSMPVPEHDDWERAPIREIAVSKHLMTSQGDVSKSSVAALIRDPSQGSADEQDIPQVIRTKGASYIDEGNHRIVAALLRGEPRIRARVLPGRLERNQADDNRYPVVNPFVSEAQRRACYAKDDPGWDCDKWEKETQNDANFRSEAQRRYLWSQHPDIAEAWAHGEHTGEGDEHLMPPGPGKDVRRRKARNTMNAKERTFFSKFYSWLTGNDSQSRHQDTGQYLHKGGKAGTKQVHSAAEDGFEDDDEEAPRNMRVCEEDDDEDCYRAPRNEIADSADYARLMTERANTATLKADDDKKHMAACKAHEDAAEAHRGAVDGADDYSAAQFHGNYADYHQDKAELHRVKGGEGDPDYRVKNMKRTFNKDFSSDEERKAAFAHMAEAAGGGKGGAVSGRAISASRKAVASNDDDDHDAAAVAHYKAADYHKKQGNEGLAAKHRDIGDFHEAKAGLKLNKDFSSDAERKAAFAHMADDDNGGAATKSALGESKHAERTGSAGAHKAAASAHRDAAESHEEKGNDELAAMHTSAAKYHDKQARSNNERGLCRNCACALNADQGAAADDGDDDDEGYITAGRGKKRKGIADEEDDAELYNNQRRNPSADEWLRGAPQEVRQIVNDALSLQKQEKRKLVQKLTANVGSPTQREQLQRQLMSEPLEKLRQLQLLAPQRASSASVPAPPPPSYLGATGFAANIQSDDDKQDYLPLPTVNYQEWSRSDE